MTIQEKITTAGRREITGTQCIRRSFAIVRLLAGSSEEGEKLVDIANEVGLAHPTAHRILKALEDEGIVERALGSQRYRLAAETAWLGVAPFNRCPITRYASAHLDELTRITGDSVLLSVPSHIDSVYADRRFGNIPTLIRHADIGSRRPLGLGIGGRVMLAFMNAGRVETTLAENAARYAQAGVDVADIRADIEEARSLGYLVANNPLSRESRIAAIPVKDITGRAIGAICLVGPRSPGFQQRIDRTLPHLRAAARDISDAIQQQRLLGRNRLPSEMDHLAS